MQGSSVGVSIVSGIEEAMDAAGRTIEEYGRCLIEQFIPGRELAVGILEGEALPIIEIRTQRRFYDYQAKYMDDSTEFFFDTIVGANKVEEIKSSAVRCYERLGCRHFARVDFILNDDVVYVLELNTIPGLTTHSLLPKAANRSGLSMSRFCVRIVEAAMVKNAMGRE